MALGDVVFQQLDAVDAHKAEECVVPLLEFGPPELDFHGGQLASQDRDEEISTTASGLKNARVDASGFGPDDVQHRLDQPRWREDLTMVRDPPLRPHKCHELRLMPSSDGTQMAGR